MTKTVKTGIKEASVTIPNPANPEFVFDTILDTPMPRATTSGTVTGPVVIPPESHASPNIYNKFLSKIENIEIINNKIIET